MIRGPTGKFFYDREHDRYLFYLWLEAVVWLPDGSDIVYVNTRSGAKPKLSGGWTAIATKMKEKFGRPFNANQMAKRFEIIHSGRQSEAYADELFTSLADEQFESHATIHES